jgi:hypothetical protein
LNVIDQVRSQGRLVQLPTGPAKLPGPLGGKQTPKRRNAAPVSFSLLVRLGKLFLTRS